MSSDVEVEDVRSLLQRPLEPPRFAVDGLIPLGGVTLLAGRPKHGKSWLALDLALGVGTGTTILGGLPCTRGPVLYLALEDSPSRMRRRVEALLDDATPPDDMLVAYRWRDGLDGLAAWARDRPGGLVVIDVLAKFTDLGCTYHAQYQAMGPLNDLARRTGIAILVVTHTTKIRARTDVLAAVSGSTAITAAADAILVLEKETPGSRSFPDRLHANDPVDAPTCGLLQVDGKDIDSGSWRLTREGAHWVITERDTHSVAVVSEVEYQILDALGRAHDEGHPTLQRHELQARLPHIPGGTVGRLLSVLVDMHLIERVARGRYRLTVLDASDPPC